jgi:hypothetical protein
MMKVHRVRTRTLWPFLLAFSASASVLGGEEVEVAGPFTLFDKMGTGLEKGGACFVDEDFDGRFCAIVETGLSTVVGCER